MWDGLEHIHEFCTRADMRRKRVSDRGATGAKELRWEPLVTVWLPPRPVGVITFLAERWVILPISKGPVSTICYASQNARCVHSHNLGWFQKWFHVLCDMGLNHMVRIIFFFFLFQSWWHPDKGLCLLQVFLWHLFWHLAVFLFNREKKVLMLKACGQHYLARIVLSFLPLVLTVSFHFWKIKPFSIHEVLLRNVFLLFK